MPSAYARLAPAVEPFQTTMALRPLPQPNPPSRTMSSSSTWQYMSLRRPWAPTRDIPPHPILNPNEGPEVGGIRLAQERAFGGHAYAQAGIAAGLAIEDMERQKGSIVRPVPRPKLHLHSVQGAFCSPGWVDRPFIYTVTQVSKTHSMHTMLVTARQPTQPSTADSSFSSSSDLLLQDFPRSDAALPLGPVCFTSLCTFRRACPPGYKFAQAEAPQIRYQDILMSRPPESWEPEPPLDLNGVTSAFPNLGEVSTFPGTYSRKVDMRSFNKGKPITDHRQLILYRGVAPLPPVNKPEQHALLHAYAADHNGLLYLANWLGFGHRVRAVGSLSCSFYVHVDETEALVMREHEASGGDDDDLDGWWIREIQYDRAEDGRCMLVVKIWSPEGVHVATVYQDGVIKEWTAEGKL